MSTEFHLHFFHPVTLRSFCSILKSVFVLTGLDASLSSLLTLFLSVGWTTQALARSLRLQWSLAIVQAGCLFLFNLYFCNLLSSSAKAFPISLWQYHLIAFGERIYQKSFGNLCEQASRLVWRIAEVLVVHSPSVFHRETAQLLSFATKQVNPILE